MIIYNGNIQVSSTKPISNFLFFLSSYTFTSYTHTHTHNHHQTPNQIFTKLNHDRYTITIRFTFSLTLYTHTYTQKTNKFNSIKNEIHSFPKICKKNSVPSRYILSPGRKKTTTQTNDNDDDQNRRKKNHHQPTNHHHNTHTHTHLQPKF